MKADEITFEDLHDLDAPDPEKVPSGPAVEFNEPCPKCGGSGSYGRVTQLGHSRCTKCEGSGKLTFRTSKAQRAKARKYAARAKERRLERNAESFAQARPDLAGWLQENAPRDAFAAILLENVRKHGSLTENQEAAVLRNIAADDEKAEVRSRFVKDHPEVASWLERAAKNGNAFALDLQHSLRRFGVLTDPQRAAVERSIEREKGGSIDLSELPAGTYAVPGGDTRLKVRIRRPGKNSRWYGWIFVDDGAEYGNRRNYGRQAPGKLYQGDIQNQLQAILRDPYEAATAYGKLTGTCCICGRMLEDEQSVAAGIGPICARRF